MALSAIWSCLLSTMCRSCAMQVAPVASNDLRASSRVIAFLHRQNIRKAVGYVCHVWIAGLTTASWPGMLSPFRLSLPICKALRIFSRLAIECDCSERNVQLFLSLPNLCNSNLLVPPFWVAELPFDHAVQSYRHPLPTSGIEFSH